MVPKEDGWSIVINGHWNRMIFTPKWVGENIFNSPEVELLVSMVPTNPAIYRNEDVVLAVAEEKVSINLRKLNVVCMEDAEAKATRILNILSHTPVSAIGVNFAFIEESPSDPLLKIFGNPHDAEIARVFGADISKRTLTRAVKLDGVVFNLALMFDGSVVEFNANYHHSVESAAAAVRSIEKKTGSMHDSLLRLVDEVYGLKPAEEQDHG